ncbi:MAG TPA: GNAT family N-acetyltransferase [Geminicoccaceae bacterium]
MSGVTVRPARIGDAPAIVRLVRELASYEGLLDEVRISEDDVRRDGFGRVPKFECLLAEHRGESVGFALFFENYSTFEGRLGIFVEDLFVQEDARGLGIGRMLLARLAAEVVRRGGRRLDLGVLHWNPARRFYHRLGFSHREAWLPYRLQGDALRALAGSVGS